LVNAFFYRFYNHNEKVLDGVIESVKKRVNQMMADFPLFAY
jgi:hypothetical protein